MKHYTVVFTPRAERQLDALRAHQPIVAVPSAGRQLRRRDRCRLPVASRHFRSAAQSATIFVRTLRTKGFARRVTIAFSVNVSTEIVAIHGVFYGGQDFEQLLRDTGSDVD